MAGRAQFKPVGGVNPNHEAESPEPKAFGLALGLL